MTPIAWKTPDSMKREPCMLPRSSEGSSAPWRMTAAMMMSILTNASVLAFDSYILSIGLTSKLR